jgi:YfiH family protein
MGMSDYSRSDRIVDIGPQMRCLMPEWPALPHIHAYTTLREGGVSLPPYATLNLATHVGDRPEAVSMNRERVQRALKLPSPPLWLSQTHSHRVMRARPETAGCYTADGLWTHRANEVCAVLTADCLPILFCDLAGSRVAAVHAGWRGLARGIIEVAVRVLQIVPSQVLAWLGPAIGPEAFEVGDEVREVFVRWDETAVQAFCPARPGHWLADIYSLARQRLAACGIAAVYGGGWCTGSDPQRFFSYRRDGVTGRMASLIWRTVPTSGTLVRTP